MRSGGIRCRVALQYDLRLRRCSEHRDDDGGHMGADGLPPVVVVHQQAMTVLVVVEAVDAEAVDRFEVHGGRARTNRDEPRGAFPFDSMSGGTSPICTTTASTGCEGSHGNATKQRERQRPVLAGAPSKGFPTQRSHSIVQAARTTTQGHRIGRVGTFPAQLRPVRILDGHRGATQRHRMDASLHALRMCARCPWRCEAVSRVRRRRQPIRQHCRRKVPAAQATQYAWSVCDIACEAAMTSASVRRTA